MGSVPIKELLDKPREVSLVKSPISVGSVPVKVLKNKDRKNKLVQSPISVGSVPVKVLESKYKLVFIILITELLCFVLIINKGTFC